MLDKKIVLASKSPRRKYLLEQAGFDIEVMGMDVEEVYPHSLPVQSVPVYLAELKARAAGKLRPNDLIICADTVVIFENKIIGKPKDLEDAANTVRLMAGETHEVITGVCFKQSDKLKSFSCSTLVELKSMTEEEIQYYVNNYEVLDKAGSYGIQDWIGWCKISKLEGSYSNVMGLPVARVYEELGKF